MQHTVIWAFLTTYYLSLYPIYSNSPLYRIFTFLTVYAWHQGELTIEFRELNYKPELKGKKSADMLWNAEKNWLVQDTSLAGFSFYCPHLGVAVMEQFPAISCKDLREIHTAGKSNLRVRFWVKPLTLSLIFWKFNRIPCGLSHFVS